MPGGESGKKWDRSSGGDQQPVASWSWSGAGGNRTIAMREFDGADGPPPLHREP